jgi:transglutaminase-like putative cysteine protease
MVWAGTRALAQAGVGRTLPWRPIAVAAAVVAVGVGTGLVWSVVSALRTASSTTGPADILAPMPGYTGRMSWSEPAAYLPLAIAALVAALAAAAAFLLRHRRLPATLVGLAGAAIVLAVAVPASPLHDVLVRDPASPRAGLAGPFLPWMVAAFFGWAAALLFLALVSDRHAWAFFFYMLLWTFWLPPMVMKNLPSLGVERPSIASGGATEALMNSRLADRLRAAGGLPLENGSLVSLTNTGALSLAPGMSALQAKAPPSLPVFRVEGAAWTSYLRTGTGDVYEGGRWRSFPEVPVDVPAGGDFGAAVSQALSGGPATLGALPAGIQPGLLSPSPGSARAYQEELKVAPPPGAEALGPGTVPVSAFPRSAEVDSVFDPLSGTLAAAQPAPEVAWQAETPAYSEEELRTAEFADAPAYLQLPSDLPQRVKDLAHDITRLERTPYAKARAIERYLKSNYRYGFADEPTGAAGATGAAGDGSGPAGIAGRPVPGSPGGDPAPGASDPVDRFLFEQRTGTCGNFSSAFVVLSRAAGIPSRVVSGWSISPTPGVQTVGADQAHQWAEVAFSPLGWVPFEPTPADGTTARAAAAGGAAPVARQPEGTAPLRESEAPAIAAAAPTPVPARPPASAPGATAGTGGAGATLARTPAALPGQADGGGAAGAPPAGTSGTPGTGTPPAGSQPPGTPPAGTATPSPTPLAAPTPPTEPDPPTAELAETVTEVLNIDPPRLRAGFSGTVSGSVTSPTGVLVDGPAVEIYINREKAQGGTLIGTGSVSAGGFAVAVDLPADLPVGKYQVIARTVASSRFAESWSDPEVEVFAGTIIRWRGPVDAVVGEATAFSGALTTDAGQPVPGAVIAVAAEGRTFELTTAADGAFATAITFQNAGPQQVSARFAGSDLNLPQDASLAVTARHAVTIDVRWSASIGVGEALDVTGTLTSRGGRGERGRPIEISVTGESDSGRLTRGSASTDASGGFSWSATFDSPGRRRITVSHPRSDVLEPATINGELTVGEASPGGGNALVIAGIALALMAGAGAGWGAAYIAARSRRGSGADGRGAEGQGAAVGENAAGPAAGGGAGATHETREPGLLPSITLRLELPQIEADLPPVWGAGEQLDIRAHATSAEGPPAAGVEVLFDGGPGHSTTAATDSMGTTGVTWTFGAPAAVELRCRPAGRFTAAQIPSIQLRIVDYRQEIVGLFNDFMGRYRERAKLTPSVTPRDAESALVRGSHVTDEEALDDLVSAFEESDYSEHTISRPHYVRAYRAWHTLTATPPPPPPAPPMEPVRATGISRI